jgi:hypothetical protein
MAAEEFDAPALQAFYAGVLKYRGAVFRVSVPKYSIVVPFHNEEENVTTLYDR